VTVSGLDEGRLGGAGYLLLARDLFAASPDYWARLKPVPDDLQKKRFPTFWTSVAPYNKEGAPLWWERIHAGGSEAAGAILSYKARPSADMFRTLPHARNDRRQGAYLWVLIPVEGGAPTSNTRVEIIPWRGFCNEMADRKDARSPEASGGTWRKKGKVAVSTTARSAWTPADTAATYHGCPD
jgi:hypothetical protein